MDKRELKGKIEDLKSQIAESNSEWENACRRYREEIDELEKQLETLPDDDAGGLPEDVRDIPDIYDVGDYIMCAPGVHLVWYVDSGTVIDAEEGDAEIEYIMRKRKILFPNSTYANMFKEKSQFLADCLYFKWMYDRRYVPNWNDCYENKYYVYFDYDGCKYSRGITTSSDRNEIYFSTKEIAEKCAEWLNYKYRRKKP